MIRAALLALGVLLAPDAKASDCETVAFDGARFTACTVDMLEDDVRLFLRDPRARSTAPFRGSRQGCRMVRRWRLR
jgi:uncharacterized protein YigE (DUF2233 family)